VTWLTRAPDQRSAAAACLGFPTGPIVRLDLLPWRIGRPAITMSPMKPESRFARRRRPLVIGFLLVLGGATAWMLADGDRGGVIAGVLTFAVAALTLAGPMVAAPWRDTSFDAAKLAEATLDLAREVGSREQAEQNLLMGDTGRAIAANLSYAPPGQVTWPAELVTWRCDQGKRKGSLADVADFYLSQQHGRLVILGAPGAGKTVLANQLLLDLVDRLLSGADRQTGRIVVPVRMSLPAFDPSVHEASAGQVAVQLESWMAQYLADVFGLEGRLAQALIRRGWILPVLDGLDEMDRDDASPKRAAAVVRGLNHPGAGRLRPIVVTCRNDRYQALSAVPAAPGQEAVLQDAAAVEIERLSVDRVADYIARRYGTWNGQVQQRWKAVIDELRSAPGGVLGQVLGSPLKLFMAVTEYHESQSQPAELIAMTADELNDHLIADFLPAVTRQHPRPDGSLYDDADVARWLQTLALHLEAQQQMGGSASDLDLSTLWVAAGDRCTRYASAALHVLAAGLPSLVAGILYLRRFGPSFFAPGSLFTLSALAALLGFVAWRSSRWQMNVSRLDMSQYRTARSRLRLAASLALGLALAFAVQPIFGAPVVFGSKGKVALGVASGVALWIWAGLRRSPTAIRKPSDLISQGRTYDLAIRVGFCLGVGLLLGIGLGLAPLSFLRSSLYSACLTTNCVFGVSYSDIHISVFYVYFQITFGVAVGFLIAGLLNSDSPWFRYFISSRIMARRRQLPPRPAQFIDWAYTAGLMRLSGIVVQFRHREIQKAFSSQSANLQFGDSDGTLQAGAL